MPRIPFQELVDRLTEASVQLGLAPDRAARTARIFAESSRDGVQSHGLNRFPRFAAMVRNGGIDIQATAECVASAGAIERWDGHHGIGPLNASDAMSRAIALAREHGIGAVALAHTNHWMRGGTYGWQAADAGLLAICWTNTGRNLPAWGTTAPTLGNNPLILAVPRANPDGSHPGAPHVVLDMAMSQFSYGQLANYSGRRQQLPVPGGYDVDGNLTHDPGAIEESFRALPIGFWKGSGLALLLDLFAAALSAGQATHEIASDPLKETGLSQFFLAIDPTRLAPPGGVDTVAGSLIEVLHDAPRTDPGKPPRYPGEETFRLREENLRLGVPVDDAIWHEVLAITAQT